MKICYGQSYIAIGVVIATVYFIILLVTSFLGIGSFLFHNCSRALSTCSFNTSFSMPHPSLFSYSLLFLGRLQILNAWNSFLLFLFLYLDTSCLESEGQSLQFLYFFLFLFSLFLFSPIFKLKPPIFPIFQLVKPKFVTTLHENGI